METPLSAFKFAKPAPTSPFITRMFDPLLDACRGLLTQGFFEANTRMLNRVGQYGLPAAALVGFIFCTTMAVKLDTFSSFLLGLGWILLVLIVQYISASFAPAGENVIKTSPSQMSSFAFLNCFALINIVVGVLGLFGLLFQAIRMEELKLLWAGLGAFVLCEYLACISLNPALTNITINPRITAGEEAVGILSFFLKAFLKLIPIAFGAGVVLGTASLAFDFYNFLAKDGPAYFAMTAAQKSADLILQSGLLPFTGFVAFLLLYLIVNLIRAVLAVPLKLDALIRQLPTTVENARSGASE